MTLIDREFPTYARGEARDAMLTAYRNSLRGQRDPVTGQLYDETTIRRSTMKPGRFWVEAEAIDIVLQVVQKRGDFLAQNIDPGRAASPFLYTFHGTQRKTQPLPATGASGYVRALGVLGTEWQGSTAIPDQTAIQATDEQGLTYQVIITGEVDDPDEGVLLAVQGVSTGPDTELQVGAVLKWVNPPPGSAPTCTVEVAFTGGTNRETDAEFSARLIDLRARPAGAGNEAHFRLWARQASNAVSDAFVYPTADHSGSVGVAVVQKRGTSTGPLGRLPSVGTMTVVRGFLTPPVSGEVPGQVRTIVTPWQPEYSDVVLRLGMRRNTNAGWFDAIAWPHGDEQPAVVLDTPAPSTSGFRMQTQEEATPSGDVIPQLMWWDPALSIFKRLQVSSVVAAGDPGQFDVALSVGGEALPVGARVSPYSGRLVELGKAIRDYFDSLGPGEVVDLANDIRGPVAFRRVEPSIRASYFGGSGIQRYVEDALGASLFRFTLLDMTPSEPRVPVNVSDGPYMLVPRNVGVYDF